MGTARPHRDIGYARLSVFDPDELGAIARQKQDIRRVSTATGGELVGPILVDNAISASRYARRQRKDYPKLLDMARAGLADRAIIYDLDRLLRIPRELEDLIDLVEELDGKFTVVGVNGVLDLSTADGRFFARMRVAQAAKESDDMSRRLRRKYEQMAEQGQNRGLRGRNRAFGWLDGGEEHHPVEAPLIAAAAEDMVLRGVGTNTIARRWNQAGQFGVRGTPWGNSKVLGVLTLPRNAGLREFRGEIIGTTPAPPIIDPDIYKRLCRMLEDRRREPRRRTVFTGLFRVPDGRGMTRSTGRRGTPAYRTIRPYPGVVERGPSVSISPAETLEDMVLEIMFTDIETGGVQSRAAARRLTAPRLVGEDPATVRRELVELAEDKAEGRITRDEWLAMRRPLERRLAVAEAAEATMYELSLAEAVDVDVRARWALPVEEGGYDDDRKRRILFSVFDRVEIAPAARRGAGFDPDRVKPIFR